MDYVWKKVLSRKFRPKGRRNEVEKIAEWEMS
jgi:hypothetical protein